MAETKVSKSGPALQEREIKLHADGETSRVRALLQELGATLVEPRHYERNTLFDRSDELRKASRVLRLRTVGERVELTYKGAAHYEGEIKVREEINLALDDPGGAYQLLERLGYVPRTRYEKKREVWRLADTLVCLDHTPIGDFIELEGGDIEAAREQLGLSGATVDPRSYLSLYADHRKRNRDAPEFMMFPEGEAEGFP